MILPSNNLSILPWYDSLEGQNARRWWVYGRVFPLFCHAGILPPFQILESYNANLYVASFYLYKADGTLVGGNMAQNAKDAGVAFHHYQQQGYSICVYTGLLPIFTNLDDGQYYIRMWDGVRNLYSEIFTVVNDISSYLKLQWWDVDDFVMDSGMIVYDNPKYKNILYLPSDIAKPEYTFEEDGESRDGYFFPTKQLSSKTYRFAFYAPEYLLDVMRLIRMSDYAEAYYRGKCYPMDTFLMTPEWEDNGDVAAVEAEFTTSTVAKKTGMGYVVSSRGDFNDDFNDDFDGGETGSSVPVTSITINGNTEITGTGTTSQYTITYNPSNTTQHGVTWSVKSGNATISTSGLLTTTGTGTIVIKAVSVYNSSIVAEMTITCSDASLATCTASPLELPNSGGLVTFTISDPSNSGWRVTWYNSDPYWSGDINVISGTVNKTGNFSDGYPEAYGTGNAVISGTMKPNEYEDYAAHVVYFEPTGGTRDNIYIRVAGTTE